MRSIALCATLLILMSASIRAADRQFTDEQWRQDIETLVTDLKTMHKNPFHAISESEFQSQVQDLMSRVPALSDQQIALDIARLFALIGDGHTWIRADDAWAAPRVPVALYDFEDGVFVTRAMAGHENLIGQQVIKIGDVSASDLLTLAEPFTSRDNEWSLRAWRIRALTNIAFLERVNAAAAGTSPVFTLRDADGAMHEVTLEPVAMSAYTAWIENETSAAGLELPLYRQQPGKPYWMKSLDNGDAVYMRFSSVTNDPDGPHLAAFSQELMDLVEKTKSRRLIIDARGNGGGNGDLLKPLIRRISENNRINRRGRLFVLTDRITFSAALMLTVRMDRQTEALFAGEPGGGKPNSYSEFTGFTLPNTKMSGSISSLWHEEGGPGDDREFVPMDIPVPLTSADYFANRDPVLDAVLAYKD